MADNTTRLPCSTLGAWLPTSTGSSSRGGTRLENDDKYDFRQAKQRASIKWLLSKAYNHKTPEELREPFYKDNDDVDHLKPHIVRALANAELYCMALSHLYQDPNYNNLNHWGIIQALARKGVSVAEPSDCALTESMLIQVAPLKMSAHMAVIEALMALFIKEQVTADRVVTTIKRFENLKSNSDSTKDNDIPKPSDQGEALLLWVTRSGDLLKQRIIEELGESGNAAQQQLSQKFSRLQDLSDISDGFALCALIALYCPDKLNWSEIAGIAGDNSESSTDNNSNNQRMADSLYNIQLVQRFCRDALPFNFCHLSIEDVVYLHDSIRSNMVCFLADLFSGLEVRPVTTFIQRPGMKRERIINVPDPDFHPIKSPNNLKRLSTNSNERSDSSKLSSLSSAGSQPGSLTPGTTPASGESPDAPQSVSPDENFVVQKGRGVPTLSSVVKNSASSSGSSSIDNGAELEKLKKEQKNQDTKSEERGETDSSEPSLLDQMKNIPVAGRPSDTPRRTSFYGRQTSQPAATTSAAASGNIGDAATPTRNSKYSRSRRNSIDENASQLSVENLGGSQDNLSLLGRNPDKEMRTHTGKVQQGQFIDNRELEEMENNAHNRSEGPDKNLAREVADSRVSFADLRKQKRSDLFHSSGININYMENEKSDLPKTTAYSPSNRRNSGAVETPNKTTWGAQSVSNNHNAAVTPDNSSNSADAMAAQLNSVRLKLEQRRKRIEEEKRKMEQVMDRQREKDLEGDISAVQSRWLSNNRANTVQEPRTPDIEAMDMDTYTRSLHQMNDSLHDLQSDIQRLAQQHGQIQQIMHPGGGPPSRAPHNPMDPQPFYISSDSQPPPPQIQQAPHTPQRRTWGQPQPISFAQQGGGMMSVDPYARGRQQWGAPNGTAETGQYGAYAPPIPPPPQNMYGNQDPYNSPMRDQWGNPIGPPPQQNMYNGAGGNYPGQYNQYNQQQPPYQGNSPYGPTTPNNPYNQYSSPNSMQPQTPQGRMNTPFRLHDSDGANNPARPVPPSNAPTASPLATSSPYAPPSSKPSGGSTTNLAAIRRRLSENDPASPTTAGVAPSYTRQSSRDSLRNGDNEPGPRDSSSPNHPPRRLHTSIPAPEENEMAPQNVSFIDSSTEDDSAHPSSKSELSNRLSRLNITSGSKTYRVLSDDKESSPSPTRTNRPSISSAFKQTRKGSGGEGASSGGPSSLRSNSGQPNLTEEEQRALENMKTERLKDDADATKGFVISFDDDTPKKPKPELKTRRISQAKKNSVTETMSSDGSNSSRKENVPPELMICIDMNTGNDSGSGGENVRRISGNDSSPYRKKYSGQGSNSTMRNGGSPTRDPSQWRSYSTEPDPIDPTAPPIPKFDIDPDVPLEAMVPLKTTSESEQSDSGSRNQQTGLIIGDEMLNRDPNTAYEMQRKKERIMMQSLRRKQEAEENRIRLDAEARLKREEEAKKEEEKLRKKEEEKLRREAILEQFKMKKELEKMEEEGIRMPQPVSARPVPRMRPKGSANSGATTPRQRPQTIHVDKNADVTDALRSRGNRGSSSNLSALHRSESRNSIVSNGGGGYPRTPTGGVSLAGMGTNRRPSTTPNNTRTASKGPSRRGSVTYITQENNSANLPPSGPSGIPTSLQRHASSASAYGGRTRKYSNMSNVDDEPDSPRMSRMDRNSRSVSQPRGKRDSSVSSAYGGVDLVGNRLSASTRYRGSRESLQSGMTYSARKNSQSSMYNDNDYYYGGSMRDLNNGYGRPRKASSVSHLGPGSLPGYRRRAGPGGMHGEYDDGASDISSTSGFSAFGYRSGTRLYREPATKSNRTIILNAIEYVVFPGVVNQETRNRVLDVIDRCDCPHFLLLFRDAKCQFRGMYAYYPDTEEVYKIYGTGPKQIMSNMFESFFKYNSGGKKFTKIHTKSLTVTIDAFTIHNALWLGKKAKLPDKRDMALVV